MGAEQSRGKAGNEAEEHTGPAPSPIPQTDFQAARKLGWKQARRKLTQILYSELLSLPSDETVQWIFWVVALGIGPQSGVKGHMWWSFPG